jgi:hypothetical protein
MEWKRSCCNFRYGIKTELHLISVCVSKTLAQLCMLMCIALLIMDTEECTTIIKCIQDGIYANEVVDGGPQSTLPASVVAEQVADDMNRLILRFAELNTLPAKTVVSVAKACQSVVSIMDPQKRRQAALGFLEMTDSAKEQLNKIEEMPKQTAAAV